MKRLNTETFIKRGFELYGDKYSYEKSVYVNIETKVLVFCKKHNTYFEATPRNFFKGHGCPKCGKESMAKTQSLTQEEFIKRCDEICKDKNYDFSKSVYKGANDYVTVICNEKDIYGNKHGEFKIKASHLFDGHGCRKCLNDFNQKRCAHTIDEFSEACISKFGDMFDLSNVNYINSRTKIMIKCKKCGRTFETIPYVFLKGCGCRFCNGPLMEIEINNLLDKNNIEYNYQYKNKKLFGALSLDFYLPEYNIGIECQGEQHFRPIEWFGGLDSYNLLLERDKKKFEICRNNGIRLLYYTNVKHYPQKYFSTIYTDKNDILNILLNFKKKTNN